MKLYYKNVSLLLTDNVDIYPLMGKFLWALIVGLYINVVNLFKYDFNNDFFIHLIKDIAEVD